MNITEAEFDALEYVAAVGRVATHDGPHISSLLERLRPFAKRETDSPQPVAWAVFGDGYEYVSLTPEMCGAWATENGGRTVPLYATPLTKSERFVLQEVRDIYADEDDVKCNEIAAVIDALLERTK